MSDVYKAPEAQLHEPVKDGEYGSVERALEGDFQLPPIQIIKDAWAALPGLKMPLMIGFLIYIVFALVLSAIQGAMVGQFPEASGQAIGASLAFQLLSTFLLAPMAAGLFMMALKHSVGAKAQVGEIFAHYGKIFNLFWMTILMYITVIIGFILLIIPGIYLSIGYTMAMPLLVEKNMGAWEALNTSRKAIGKKWFNMFGFLIVGSLVAIAGAVAILIGLIWTLPLVMLAYAMLYRNIFGVESTTMQS